LQWEKSRFAKSSHPAPVLRNWVKNKKALKIPSGPSYSTSKMAKKHSLIPEHAKLSDKDTAELLKKYSITLKELPRILLSDPAIEDLSVKEGDVIKITRKSPTSGESTYYRVVISG